MHAAADRGMTKTKLEGEGSYSAARNYNARLARTLKSQDVNALAKKAAKALDSKEGPELRQAEQRAKRGPAAAARR